MDATIVARPHAGLMNWLRERGIDTQIHEHETAFTAASTARVEGVDARTFAKVVGVVTDDGRIAFLVLRATDRVDLRKACQVLGARETVLLSEDEMFGLVPDCEAGAIPPVGAVFGLPMHADDGLRQDDEISFNAGTHQVSVRVDRETWEREAWIHYADLAIDAGGEHGRDPVLQGTVSTR
jgi:Ala-tRNA(Pro) deacylase